MTVVVQSDSHCGVRHGPLGVMAVEKSHGDQNRQGDEVEVKFCREVLDGHEAEAGMVVGLQLLVMVGHRQYLGRDVLRPLADVKLEEAVLVRRPHEFRVIVDLEKDGNVAVMPEVVAANCRQLNRILKSEIIGNVR